MESLNKIELLKTSISTGLLKKNQCSSITQSVMRKFQPQVLVSLIDRKPKMLSNWSQLSSEQDSDLSKLVSLLLMKVKEDTSSAICKDLVP